MQWRFHIFRNWSKTVSPATVASPSCLLAASPAVMRGSLRFWLARFYRFEDSTALSSINPECDMTPLSSPVSILPEFCCSPRSRWYWEPVALWHWRPVGAA